MFLLSSSNIIWEKVNNVSVEPVFIHFFSTLELLPKLKVDGTPAVERKLNRYAQFVKDHYSEVKSGSPWRNHKEIMDKLKDLYHQKLTL